MQVLDIYPSYCWSFQAESRTGIERLRAASEIQDPQRRAEELASLEGNAFWLVGDATGFELAEHYFDEIRVLFKPTTLKELILTRKARRWAKKGAPILIPDGKPKPAEREEYIPLHSPGFAPAQPA